MKSCLVCPAPTVSIDMHRLLVAMTIVILSVAACSSGHVAAIDAGAGAAGADGGAGARSGVAGHGDAGSSAATGGAGTGTAGAGGAVDAGVDVAIDAPGARGDAANAGDASDASGVPAVRLVWDGSIAATPRGRASPGRAAASSPRSTARPSA